MKVEYIEQTGLLEISKDNCSTCLAIENLNALFNLDLDGEHKEFYINKNPDHKIIIYKTIIIGETFISIIDQYNHKGIMLMPSEIYTIKQYYNDCILMQNKKVANESDFFA